MDKPQKILLKDLKLGKTDAKNELINDSNEEKQFFANSFLMPENVSIEDFIDKNLFFITGMKGTGKTALLRYLDIEVERRTPNSTSSFILFKSDVKEEEREELVNASNNFQADKDSIDYKEFNRYGNIWKWFFFRQIIRLSDNGPYSFFQHDNVWEDFQKCINLPLESKTSGWYSRLGVKVRHGKIELRAGSDKISMNLGIDFDIEAQKSMAKFSHLVEKAESLFSQLTPTSYPLYMFVDELEISLSKGKQYKRDVELVRDLIITIVEFNKLCIRQDFNIKIIAGVRSEVLSSVYSMGHELNKLIEDFGRPLHWQWSGRDYSGHPLMKMMIKRIQASEEYLGFRTSSEDEVWKKYFVTSINNIPIQKYLLELTWERPRDIIRLLNISKKLYGTEEKFNQKVFEGIAKNYARDSWIELAEELSTIYNAEEIDGIEELLRGIQCPFDLKEIKTETNEKMEYSANLEKLLNKYKLADVLRKLYDIGIIGNDGEMVRFSFRGDEGLLLGLPMKIVRPLWKYFTVGRRPKTQ